MPEWNCERHIALWSSSDQDDPERSRISAWARALRLDAVVWTALPTLFGGRMAEYRTKPRLSHTSGCRPAMSIPSTVAVSSSNSVGRSRRRREAIAEQQSG